MLKLGSSRPWPEAMLALTGSEKMSTEALQEYFAPLVTWLKEQNQKNGDIVGWSDTTWRPSNYQKNSISLKNFYAVQCTVSKVFTFCCIYSVK